MEQKHRRSRTAIGIVLAALLLITGTGCGKDPAKTPDGSSDPTSGTSTTGSGTSDTDAPDVTDTTDPDGSGTSSGGGTARPRPNGTSTTTSGGNTTVDNTKKTWQQIYAADFRKSRITDLSDTDQVIDLLGSAIDPTDVDGYRLAEDGGLIYDPISQEARLTGVLGKYDRAAQLSGTIRLADGAELQWSAPKAATAYDAVPVKYTVKKPANAADSYHISVTTYDEKKRTAGKANYDLNLPDDVSVKMEYLGYVNGTIKAGSAPFVGRDLDQIRIGTQYPNYTTSKLIRSGTVDPQDIVWFRFRYTNTGNTILDSEGNGTFCFEPTLSKKNAAGNWEVVSRTENIYQRIYDYVYPGEQGEFWVTFLDRWSTLEDGEYKITIKQLIRNQRSSPDWSTLLYHGYDVGDSSFTFTVKNEGATVTEPKAMEHRKAATRRNSMMHSYEEFMSSYVSMTDSSVREESGVLYVQPCPWSEGFTIRFMSGPQGDTMKSVTVPVKVTADELKIDFNADNQNYIVKADGTRYPMIVTQLMTDMRSNVQRSPYAASVILNDLRDMQEAGITYLNSTNSFQYDLTDTDGRGSNGARNMDAFQFLMEALRQTKDMKLEGLGLYPFESGIVGLANSLGAKLRGTEIAKASAIVGEYNYKRYGDLYYQTAKGEKLFVVDDSNGAVRVDWNMRIDLSSDRLKKFREFLQTRYGTVANLNKAWGTTYASFKAIDLNGKDASWLDSGSPLHEWSQATVDLDLFRTLEYAQMYQDINGQIQSSTGIGKSKIVLRREVGGWVASGIVPTTKNARLRHAYMGQRRQALIAEVLSASGAVYADSEYIHVPYRPSEVAALTARSVADGIMPMHQPQFNRMKDVALNPKIGDMNATTQYNTASLTYGAYVNTLSSVYTWWKATYENGGVPGILWQDYTVDAMVTSTQYKEMKFFKAKLEAALATPAGKAWAKKGGSVSTGSTGLRAYDESYIRALMKDTPRVCIFEDRNGI